MLLNEKRGCFSFLFFVPTVFVLPINPEVVFNILNFFFGSPGDDGSILFLKAGIWVILFAIVFGVASKMFDKKGIATIFSMVFSLISIRFIPNEYIHYIGQAYGILGLVFLVLFVIGATLFILNKYFPITEHKSYGIIWGLFYFFIAWCFHQLANLQLYEFPKIQETLEVIAPWGRVVSIVLGVACLMRALGGKSKYAREPSRRPERPFNTGGDKNKLRKSIDKLKKDRQRDREKIKNLRREGKDKKANNIENEIKNEIKNENEQIEKQENKEKQEFLKEIADKTRLEIRRLKAERYENQKIIKQIDDELDGWLDEIKTLKGLREDLKREIYNTQHDYKDIKNPGWGSVPNKKDGTWASIDYKKQEKLEKDIKETEGEIAYEEKMRTNLMQKRRDIVKRNEQIKKLLYDISIKYKQEYTKIRRG